MANKASKKKKRCTFCGRTTKTYWSKSILRTTCTRKNCQKRRRDAVETYEASRFSTGEDNYCGGY